jgi:hypothetical protein
MRSSGEAFGYQNLMEREDPWVERGYARAQEVFNRDKIVIEKYKDIFVQVHGEAEVERDLAEIKAKQQDFWQNDVDKNQEVLKLSFILEAILHEEIELNGWLGDEVNTIKTNEYDDFHSGMDDIVEFYGQGDVTYMGLAIDATTSSDASAKIRRVREDIDYGLPEVKYFHSERTHNTGKLPNVPRAVVEVHISTVKELVEPWLRGRNKELQQHWVQIQILRQLLLQFKTYEAYARLKNKRGVADRYHNLGNRISLVLEEKAELIKSYEKQGVAMDDSSYANLAQDLKRTFPEVTVV